MNYALSAVLAVLAALCGAEPLKFTESTAEPLGKKIRWTVPMAADLSDSDGFEFDFRCTNRGQFGRMSMYVFCAGAGKSSCYAVKVPIDAADDWAHVVVRKRMVYNTENHPDGWADVRSFQLTSRLVGTNGVTAWVRDWRPLPKATAAAAIIVPEKAMSDEGMLAKGRFGVHERISAAFDTLGVPSYYLSDHDLARGVPANAKLLVLQGDETLFGESVRSLETFLTRGARSGERREAEARGGRDRGDAAEGGGLPRGDVPQPVGQDGRLGLGRLGEGAEGLRVHASLG